jgi:hypothetical protein
MVAMRAVQASAGFMSDLFKNLMQEMLDDVERLMAKITWLKRVAASDLPALAGAKTDVLDFTSKAAAIAADAARLSAQLECDDGAADPDSKKPDKPSGLTH